MSRYYFRLFTVIHNACISLTEMTVMIQQPRENTVSQYFPILYVVVEDVFIFFSQVSYAPLFTVFVFTYRAEIQI